MWVPVSTTALTWCPDAGAAAPDGGCLLHAELGGGSAGGGSRPRRLGPFAASDRRACGVGGLRAGWEMAVWSVLEGRFRGLRLIAGRKPCPGCWPGPTTATHSGAASFLKASSRWCSRFSAPGSPGETLDPSRIGRGGASASLASWGLALDVPPARGSCGVMVVGGGDSSSSARWCAAPGPAWMSERRLRKTCVELDSAVFSVVFGC